jgi:alpha-tubulin suppressor-like RCC1 family protein
MAARRGLVAMLLALCARGVVYAHAFIAPASTCIASTGYAFAAIKSDGSVVRWGRSTYGGGSSSVASNLQDGVVSIASTDRAFAAIKSDGSVVTWGDSDYGSDSSSVASNLQDIQTNYKLKQFRQESSTRRPCCKETSPEQE